MAMVVRTFCVTMARGKRRYNCSHNKSLLYKAQHRKCVGCDRAFAQRALTVDHIVPKSKGGSNDLYNLQLLCQACNWKKGAMPFDDFIELQIMEEII